jgi:hypothetical protein
VPSLIPAATPSLLQVFDVLPLVLQHGVKEGDASTDPQQLHLLCTLLQVSNSVRAAIQRHGSMQCALTVPVAWEVTKWSQLARWLPRHAGHLQSLTVRDLTDEDDQSGFFDLDMAEQLVSLALQVCALSAPQPAAGAAAHGAEQLAAAPVPPLQLQRLAWSDMQGGVVLQALSTVSTLTRLELKEIQKPNAPRIVAELGSFASLQSLTVECRLLLIDWVGPCPLPAAFAGAVSHLTRLTSLTVDSLACRPPPRYLPASLVELVACVECCARDAPLRDGRVPFVLTHLTNLKVFDALWFVETGGAGIPQLSLPPQLTQFHQQHSRVEGLLPGGLRHFRATNPARFPVLIQQLRDLPDLDCLELNLFENRRLGADHGLAPVLAVLPACTRLTRLFCVVQSLSKPPGPCAS